MSVVRVDGLTKSFSGQKALQNLEFEIKEGEVFGLLGPNGSGKTTLFQIIMGQLEPNRGNVQVLGMDSFKDTYEVKKRASFLPADIRFYGNLTAKQNLSYLSSLVEFNADLEKLLEEVGLGGEVGKKVSGFSHGMEKRLGIAQTLLKDPELILFDEPTTGLDPEAQEEFKQLVKRINEKEDTTVVISSHVLHELEDICDRIGILKDGNLQVTGTPRELVEKNDCETLQELYLETMKGGKE